MTSTTDRLNEIRERERKATKGPWIIASGDDEYCSSIFGVISEAENNRVEADTSIRRGDFPADTKWIAVDPGTAPVQFAEEDNFDFIAHARADVPFLLDALDAVEKEREELRAQLSASTAREAGLRDALTPSAETKGAYIGEFKFSRRYRHTLDDNELEQSEEIVVPWDTVKEIMAAILARGTHPGALLNAALSTLQPATPQTPTPPDSGAGGEVERLREADPLQLDGKLTDRGERLMNWTTSLNYSASPEIMLAVRLVRRLSAAAESAATQEEKP